MTIALPRWLTPRVAVVTAVALTLAAGLMACSGSSSAPVAAGVTAASSVPAPSASTRTSPSSGPTNPAPVATIQTATTSSPTVRPTSSATPQLRSDPHRVPCAQNYPQPSAKFCLDTLWYFRSSGITEAMLLGGHWLILEYSSSTAGNSDSRPAGITREQNAHRQFLLPRGNAGVACLVKGKTVFLPNENLNADHALGHAQCGYGEYWFPNLSVSFLYIQRGVPGGTEVSWFRIVRASPGAVFDPHEISR
jgi:hypothetical protein